MNKVYKVGLIGCGHINETYFRAHEYFNNFKIIKCADVKESAAKNCANVYNIESVSVDDLLVDNQIEVVLNLTTPQSHYEVTKKTLLAGKHSYCEKPLATKFENGQELVNLAKEKNLYLGNAPDTFLGAGNQKSRQLIDSELVGDIKLGNAIFAFPGVQSYHPDPEPWFQKDGGGPVFDMGPYYLTALVNLLGPAKHVQGRELTISEFREIGIGPKKGKKIKVESPTTYMATIQFHNSAIIQITLSFDVINHQRNHIELYGTKGSIIVPDPNMFGGSVFISVNPGPEGKWEEYQTENMKLGKINIKNPSVRLNESPTNANYRGIGLSEMLYCIENKKKHRCSGELSLHVLDIIDSTMQAAISKTHKEIRTTCKKPEFFPEEEIKKIFYYGD